MMVTDDIFVMLLTEEKFKTFTPNEICDAKKYTEALVCLSLESRAKVDEMVRKAVAAGGATYNKPQDHGFMYGHGFQEQKYAASLAGTPGFRLRIREATRALSATTHRLQ